jgi:hypothetical protein
VPAIDPGTILPHLIFGALAVAAGILIVINRRPPFDSTVRNLQAVNRGSSKAVARLSSPFWVGAVGVTFMLIGLLMVAGAAVGIVQLAA